MDSVAVKTCRQQEVVLDRDETPGGENVRTTGRAEETNQQQAQIIGNSLLSFEFSCSQYRIVSS